jgi:ribosomal protein S18 acetylase RimI-like enzyme
MFATGSLARRIEGAEASLIEDAGAAAARRAPGGQAFVTAIGGGVAAYSEPGSPINKVAGLGFAGVPAEEDLAAVEAAYARRQCPVVVELSSFADPAVGRLLTKRGYELIGYENVSGLVLDSSAPTLEAANDGPIVSRVAEQDGDAWLEAVIAGFLHPDTYDGLPSHESYAADIIRRAVADMAASAGFERYAASHASTILGGASFRTFKGIAQMCGSATVPEHRRRGVQTALLRHRLAEAARRGCDVAVVTTQPGSKSQQNVERFGFALLYVRAVLTRNGRPLTTAD